MATRKIVSFLTVLMMITSGVTLTAFAEAPLPGADTQGASSVVEDALIAPASDVIMNDDFEGEEIGSHESPLETEFVPKGASTEGLTEVPNSLTGLLELDFESKGNLPQDLGMGYDGGELIRGITDHRAPNKILLVDDDDSTAVNSTQQWNNSGLFNTDTGKLWSDALTSAGYAHDHYIVRAGRSGPDYATMSQYSTIIWAFGYEFGYLPTLTQYDYWRLISFMEAGGSVWLSGPLWMYDLYGNQNVTDFNAESFAKKYLGIEEYYPLVGQPNPVNTTADANIMLGSEQYATRNWFNDEGDLRYLLGSIVRPVSTGSAEIIIGDIVDFFGNSYDDEPFVIGYDSGNWRAVTGTIDPAVITSDTDRSDFVGKVMAWLGTPTIDTTRVNIMNMNVSVDDQSPLFTTDFDRYYWAVLWQDTAGNVFRFFSPIVATVHTHEDFTFTANFENQGPAQNNFNVRIIISDSMGNVMKNYTKQTSVGTRTIGSVSDSYKPTRAGFYLVRTNVTVANDVYRLDNTLAFSYWVRAAEWLDDLENGTSGWSKEGSWRTSTDSDHYQTASTGWLWQKTGTSDSDGDALQPPTVDLRFYNVSFDHWYFTNAEIIFFNFYFHGRLHGTGQDYFEILYKASNMTTWNSFFRIDGTTTGENDVPGDFDDEWWFFGRGLYLGNYYGRTVDIKFVMVKRNPAPPHSWVAIDDFIVWMGHERNEPPWFLNKYMKVGSEAEMELDPDTEDLYVDVGTEFDLRVFVEDPTMDEPITYQWVENTVPLDGQTTNATHFNIPQTVPAGHKYERGNTLEVAVYASDDLMANGTLWYIHLMDPRPVLRGTDPLELEFNEDEATPFDFGTNTNPTWFEDIEGQSFTVTSSGSTHISVSEGTNNVLTFNNRAGHENWNGKENVTIKVKDEADSVSEFVFEVTVVPVNDAPEWRQVKPLKKAQEGTYYSVNITFGVEGEFLWVEDVDNEFNDMTYSTNATFFTFAGTPEIAFNPTNADVGVHRFNVTVSDGELSATIDLRLEVNNVNQAPKLLPIPNMVAYEDEEFTFDLSEYVDDIDLLIPEPWRTDFIEYRENHRDIDINIQTGLVTWTPENKDVGDHYVEFSVTDSESKTATQQVYIEVRNTNDAPTIGVVPKQRLSQGNDFTLTMVVDDDDLEENVKDAGYEDSHVWSNDHTELFEIGSTGQISFTPENEDVGTWEVTIVVTDSEGASASRVVIFEILNINDEPKFDDAPLEVNVVEDVPFTLWINASDPDMEPRKLDGEPVDPSESLSFRTNNTDVSINDEGKLTFTPTNTHAMRRNVVVRIFVYDNEGDEKSHDLTFRVEQVNDLPENLNIIGLVDLQKIKEGSKVTLRGTATDQEDSETKLIYKWYAGTVNIGSQQVFEWEVKGSGQQTITLEVTDSMGGVSTKSINVTIEKKEEEPGFEMAFAVMAISIIAVMAATVRRRRFH